MIAPHLTPQRRKHSRFWNLLLLAFFSFAALVTIIQHRIVGQTTTNFTLPVRNLSHLPIRYTTAPISPPLRPLRPLDPLFKSPSRTRPLSSASPNHNSPPAPQSNLTPNKHRIFRSRLQNPDRPDRFDAQDHIRPVPPHIPRFSYPWRLPPRPTFASLKSSRHRLLYSALRGTSSEGLGHAMATVNADITTAWRLGLTYTHRIARYGSLTHPPCNASIPGACISQKNATNIQNLQLSDAIPYRHVAAVEYFFGWGANEIPREAVQRAICPSTIHQKDEKLCRVCNASDLAHRKAELARMPSANRTRARGELHVDRVVQLPLNLTYRWAYGWSGIQTSYLNDFLEKHNYPNTVFMMSPEVCKNSPAYSKFLPQSRSFFFHKYWAAHQSAAKRGKESKRAATSPLFDTGATAKSFIDFVTFATSRSRLGRVPRRPILRRMLETEVNVAVHARRGDFFKAGRPMVSARAFARVLRAVAAMIASGDNVFAQMPISVAIYSEGQAVRSGAAGHDISKMDTRFVDVDGRVLDEKAIESMLRNGGDGLGEVFANGLKLSLRTSQNTMLCLHEMVAADVFVGSRSGLSMHIVGSLSRGAMQLLPWRDDEAGDSQVLFHGKTGEVDVEEMHAVRRLWASYVRANEASARQAMEEVETTK